MNRSLNFLKANTDTILLAALVLILAVMIVPLPPSVLDLLLTFSLAFSMGILLVTMYARKALEFSVFPTLLLIVTLARLALNVAATRLILLNGHAGEVIQTFGQFVVGGNYVVGFILFVILVVINFVVITNGAGRVAEVGARFTLDAMPGKQMSIDADLAAGLIGQDVAQARRREVEREADFYGSMDGAAKFVRGDAIAAVLIMLINIIGGLTIGVLQKKMGIGAAAQTYTLLTVGEGLVTQIPALLVSTATGIIVTRAASESHLGEELAREVIFHPVVISRVGWLLAAFGLIPGMPKLTLWGLSAAAFYVSRAMASPEAKEKERAAAAAAKAAAGPEEPEDMKPLLDIEPVELAIGYALVALVDAQQGGDLLHRIVQVRRSCATELGVVVPPIRIRDDLQLRPGQYRVRLYGQSVAEGEVMPGRLLAMSSGLGEERMEGVACREPAFGLPALWISEAQRDEAEMKRYTVVDPASVITTHLAEMLRSHMAELLGRQEVQELVDGLRARYPKLVEDVIPSRLSLTEIRLILQSLLRERVSVRDLRRILETVADHLGTSRDPQWLTEKCREALALSITAEHLQPDRTLPAVALAPGLEAELEKALPGGSGMEQGSLRRIAEQISQAANMMASQGLSPVVVCSQKIRPLVRRIMERVLPSLAVLSYEEMIPGITLDTIALVGGERR